MKEIILFYSENSNDSSQIITNNSQRQFIQEKLFPKKVIKKTSLAYKTTQSELVLQDFYKNTQNKENLLIVLKTNYNNQKKSFGGFSPKPWHKFQAQSKKFYKFQIDQNNQTFLFSLTYEQKLVPQTGKRGGIMNQTNYGPIFATVPVDNTSVDPDMAFVISQIISLPKNYIKFKEGFTNETYQNDSEQLRKRFIGSQEKYFSFQSMQVWVIGFQKK